MMESLTSNVSSPVKLTSIIKARFKQETPKSVQIQLLNGIKIWVPKRYIDSQYSFDTSLEQNFLVENYILKKLGFKNIF
jgi:hypothetical protein